MPTLHVIDPLLVNEGGHYLGQHMALWYLCQAQGYRMESYAHVDFAPELMPAGVKVHPVFGTAADSALSGHYCVDLGSANSRCYEELAAVDCSRFKEDDIVFLTSLTAERAVAYGRWLREHAAGLKSAVGIYAIVSSEIDDTLGRDIRRNGLPISDGSFALLDEVVVPNELKRSMYRYLFDSIPEDKSTRYKIFYEEPFHNRTFIDCCRNPEVEFVYLHSMYPGPQPPVEHKKEKGRLKVGYMGSGGVSSVDKGVHLIREVIERAVANHTHLAFSVHLGSARAREGVSDEQKQLLDFLQDNKQVELDTGLLNCQEYCALIEGVDIVLLPYGDRYRHIMSGIFDDSLFLAKVCVIPAGSKMALWMERHNLDFPAFKHWSVEGVSRALDDAVVHYDHYKAQFLEAQAICRRRWQKLNPLSVFLAD